MKKTKHVVIYLPPDFYSAIASSIIEMLLAINEIKGEEIFSVEFVSRQSRPVSRSGITFHARTKPSRKMDVLILLAGISLDTTLLAGILRRESKFTGPLLQQAVAQQAIIAGTCGAGLLLAHLHILNGKRATVAWWVKHEAQRLFPEVHWEPSRMVVRQGRIYTSGAVYGGMDLLSAVLIDLGFAEEERQVRKIMAMPAVRQFQTPYEMQPSELQQHPFEKKLDDIAAETGLDTLTGKMIARKLTVSYRTLSRKFADELRLSPAKWLQQKRLDAAKALLETTTLNISEICYQVGYQDLASFSRLFVRTTGMTPGEFRRQVTR
ncbi:helix-turn-helix domain-containing protein [Chitinophaga varians]|uniref:Helix-turn-helix domain-containing protein n=1 Tax=Chitinophaga varians TaxID=2202339 RepID=A0A847RRC7_9BACT|nr:helix-turn-helix domain-containing protein [Chitinophaga varians]NLR63285.1 helix-turn-helix domain-containing protein [Chitinophaga varians]